MTGYHENDEKVLPVPGNARPMEPSGDFRGRDRWFLLFLCAGLALFVYLLRVVYRNTAPAPAGPAPVAAPAPSAPEPLPTPGPIPGPEIQGFVPLKRGVAATEAKYTGNMRLEATSAIASGPLKGGYVKRYRTGNGADELTAVGDSLYKRSTSFLIAEIEQKKDDFSSLVYVLALYPAAYDINFGAEGAPDEVREAALEFGVKCKEILGQPGREHYSIAGDYVFGCINEGDKRLRYEAISAGLFREEKMK